MAVKPTAPYYDDAVEEDRPTRRSYPSFEPFSVEVKEIVATIAPGAGEHGPIAAAFLAAGTYMQDNDHPLTLEFSVYGMHFTAKSENDEEVN